MVYTQKALYLELLQVSFHDSKEVIKMTPLLFYLLRRKNFCQKTLLVTPEMKARF